MLATTLRPTGRTTNRAFTLIELLVVIAIIAILAAILFPVFAQAREKARQTACLSNLKQLGLATMQYVQDYDETFPMAEYGKGPGEACGEQYFWATFLQPYVKMGDFEVNTSGVKSYFGRGGIFECPNAPDVSANAPSWSPAGKIRFSYAPMNTLFVNNWDNCGVDPTKIVNNGVPIAALTKPAEMVMIAEKGANNAGWSYPWIVGEQWGIHDTSVKTSGVIDPSKDGSQTADRNDCDSTDQSGGGLGEVVALTWFTDTWVRPTGAVMEFLYKMQLPSSEIREASIMLYLPMVTSRV